MGPARLTVIAIASLGTRVAACSEGAREPAAPTVPEVQPAVTARGATIEVSISTPDGRQRTAHLYTPASLPAEPVALLVALHGGTGSGSQFEETSGYDELAEANGFLVVYPDGVGSGDDEARFRTWNGGVCCGAAAAEDVDDVSFLVQLVEELSAEHRIDPARVYATGHSNGMIMSYRLVCEAADVFVAAAGQAGTLGVEGCAPSQPVSLLHIHGEEDTNLPLDGGPGTGMSRTDFPSPREGIRTLAHGDGCDPDPAVTSAPPVTNETWTGCDGATVVELATIAGASHAWMGADAKTRPGASEPFSDYDSSLASWTFLAAHPRTG